MIPFQPAPDIVRDICRENQHQIIFGQILQRRPGNRFVKLRRVVRHQRFRFDHVLDGDQAKCVIENGQQQHDESAASLEIADGLLDLEPICELPPLALPLTEQPDELSSTEAPMSLPLHTASGAIEQLPLVLVDLETAAGITGRAYLIALAQPKVWNLASAIFFVLGRIFHFLG